jgi:hypothetical protein
MGKLWRRLAAWMMRLFGPPPLPPPAKPIVPFDWTRDYGPLWEPGSSAFWLEPDADDIKPGVWPMPFTKPKPVPAMFHPYATASGLQMALQQQMAQAQLQNAYTGYQQSLLNSVQQQYSPRNNSLASILGLRL